MNLETKIRDGIIINLILESETELETDEFRDEN